MNLRKEILTCCLREPPDSLPTPISHLPPGYPFPSIDDAFLPILKRAFEIHQTAHTFKGNLFSPRTLAVINGAENYCDCYERAWQEFNPLKPLIVNGEGINVKSRI